MVIYYEIIKQNNTNHKCPPSSTCLSLNPNEKYLIQLMVPQWKKGAENISSTCLFKITNHSLSFSHNSHIIDNGLVMFIKEIRKLIETRQSTTKPSEKVKGASQIHITRNPPVVNII